jgi:hypothetical protein
MKNLWNFVLALSEAFSDARLAQIYVYRGMPDQARKLMLK